MSPKNADVAVHEPLLDGGDILRRHETYTCASAAQMQVALFDGCSS